MTDNTFDAHAAQLQQLADQLSFDASALGVLADVVPVDPVEVLEHFDTIKESFKALDDFLSKR